MTLPPSVATLLRKGVRDLVAALDPGYPVIAGIPQPGKADGSLIAINTYPAGIPTEELAAGQTITACQVTIRGSSFDGSDPVQDAQEAIRDALTWNTPRVVNGVEVVLSFRQLSSGPPVLDNQGRPTVFDTFDMRSGRLGLIPQH